MTARPVVEELRLVARSSPSRDLVALVERAVGHVVKVILHADAEAAGQGEWFATRIADLREQHRRRPTFIAMLDKAGLG